MPQKTFFRLDEEKQERIMRSAIHEFNLHGYDDAKISAIAQGAGVAKGSIYQYFAGKEELFNYAIRWGIEYFMKRIGQQTPMENMDVFDYLLEAGRPRFDLLKSERDLVVFSEDVFSGKYGPRTKAIIDEMNRYGEQQILRLVANGKAKGTIRRDLDDRLVVIFYQGVTRAISDYGLAQAEKFGLDMADEQFLQVKKTLDELVELLRKGIGS